MRHRDELDTVRVPYLEDEVGWGKRERERQRDRDRDGEREGIKPLGRGL